MAHDALWDRLVRSRSECKARGHEWDVADAMDAIGGDPAGVAVARTLCEAREAMTAASRAIEGVLPLVTDRDAHARLRAAMLALGSVGPAHEHIDLRDPTRWGAHHTGKQR